MRVELAPHGSRPGRAALAMPESPAIATIHGILNLENDLMPPSHPSIALSAVLLVAPAVLIASQAGAPGSGSDRTSGSIAEGDAQKSSPEPDRARIEEFLRRTRHGADMFLDVQGRAYTLAQIAGVQARAGDREASRSTFRQAEQLAGTVGLDDSRYSPHILLWIVRAEAGHGFRDEAIAAARELLRIAEAPIRSEPKKQDVYINLIKDQVELGDRAGVQQTLEAGRKFFTAGLEPGFRVFSPVHLVQLQAASGDLTGALRMIRDPVMFKEPRPANTTDLRLGALLAIVQEIRPGDWEVARPILEEAARAVAAENDPLAWRGTMIKNGHLQVIAVAQARIGRFDEALRTARMIDAGAIPAHPARMRDEQGWRRAMTLASIALEQAKAGDEAGTWRSAREATRIVEALQGDSLKYPLWLAAEALARIGKVEGARQVADALGAAKRIEVYSLIAATRQEAGDDAGAQTTFRAALDLARRRLDDLEVMNRGPEDSGGREVPINAERDGLLESLGRLQAKLGDRKQAIEMICRINDDGREIEALKRLAADLAAAGDLDGALEAISPINSPKSEAEALEAVASALSRRKMAPPTRR